MPPSARFKLQQFVVDPLESPAMIAAASGVAARSR